MFDVRGTLGRTPCRPFCINNGDDNPWTRLQQGAGKRALKHFLSLNGLNLLKTGAEPYLREPYADPVQEQWFGWRPMTPDGKPIIDRVVKADTALPAVAQCALVSMDSTIRSNLSVGMPLDLAIVRRDALQISLHRSIGPDDAYFKVIRDGWGESLRNAFYALPDPSIP